MRLDPTLLSALSIALESIVNEALKYDPGTRSQLIPLVDEQISFVISDMQIALSTNIGSERMAIAISPLAHFEGENSSTILRGELKDFLSLAKENTSSLAGSGVDVQGKVGTLETLQSLLKNIDIDWQDALHQKLGPLAYPLNAFLNKAGDFVRQNTQRNQEIINEYLEHESGLNVHPEELANFSTGVAQLRSSTDRIEAKLKQLMRHPALKENS